MINVFKASNLEALTDIGFLTVEGNITKAEKLFVANALLNWAYNGLASEKLTPENMLGVINILADYQKDKAIITWVNGEPHFKKRKTT
jgi:hypothetical protein